MNKAEVTQEFSEKRGQFWLWFSFLLPPIVWITQLQTVYLLTEYACGSGNFSSIHIVSIVSLVLSIFGFLVSWRNWMKTGGEWKSEGAGGVSRSRFMAILGVLTGALFTLVIFAQWLPTILGVPCDK